MWLAHFSAGRERLHEKIICTSPEHLFVYVLYCGSSSLFVYIGTCLVNSEGSDSKLNLETRYFEKDPEN